jgi:hypothetical protein
MMNIPIIGRVVDERFLMFRLRSTSVAGIIVAVASILVFAYRFYVQHVWSWDLLAVGIAFVAIKLTMMTWFYLTN